MPVVVPRGRWQDIGNVCNGGASPTGRLMALRGRGEKPVTSNEPVHTEAEAHPWSVNVPDHPARQDSPEYVAARQKMNQLAGQATGLIYGPGPFQDHHGGALWLKDAQGWFMVRNQAGIEW